MTIAVLAALALAAAQPATANPSVSPSEVSVSAATAADGTHVLVHEVAVEAPAREVWEAVSTAQGWTTWAVPVAWQDDDLLETSYTPTASRGDPSTIRQQILAREPGRRLVFRTVKAPEGFPHWTTYQQVTSVFELEPVGDGTLVRLTSTGYPDTAAGRDLVAFFNRGNTETLEGLQKSFASKP